MFTPYKPRDFNLSSLKGISDETLEMHFKLYEGYVKETNKLNERIAEFIKDAKVDQEEFAAYSELTRRLGFEYNGMVLHEYYFENLTSGGGTGDPTGKTGFRPAAEESFGSYDIWKADFVSTGKMRGVGWAICYENPSNGRLSNHWILACQETSRGQSDSGEEFGSTPSSSITNCGSAEVHRAFFSNLMERSRRKTAPATAKHHPDVSTICLLALL